MTEDRDALQETYYIEARNSLQLFLQVFDDYVGNTPDLEQAYDALPQSVKQRRSLEELVVDEITDIFVALTYNGKNRHSLNKLYCDIRNTYAYGESRILNEKEADRELKQRYAQIGDEDKDNIQTVPHFFQVFAKTMPVDETNDLIQEWADLLNNMSNCAQDKNGIAQIHRYVDLTHRFQNQLEQLVNNQNGPQNTQTPANQSGALSQAAYAEQGFMSPDDVQAKVQEELQNNQQIHVLQRILEEYESSKNSVLKALRELGADIDLDDELEELKHKVETLPLSEEARKKAEKELKTLEGMSRKHHAYDTSYLEKLVAWPWGQYSEVSTDIRETREILDADHYGLEDVKKRILEQIAIQRRAEKTKLPVICLVGPSGVGKTSLGKSLARAMNREFVKMALGGIQGDNQFRGWPQSYKSAEPGGIFEKITKAGTLNPLFLLDEVDKLSKGGAENGSAVSALLEVLDPEQNQAFKDHYMGNDVSFDVSQAMFVTTANDISRIPATLRDRMLVIQLEPYVTEEKLEIGKAHLVPRQKREKGVENTGLEITDDAIRDITINYAPEAGVRKLEQQIGRICAQHARAIEEGEIGEDTPVEITPDKLEDYLGPPLSKQDVKNSAVEKGVVHGLAASDLGGSVLEIKAVNKPGNGEGFKLETTAVGDVGGMMERSAKVASAYIQNNHHALGICQEEIMNTNLHIHVVDGGNGVDGPSAGAAFTTAILSAAVASAQGREIRSDIAMTGTVEPDGKVGKIGGLKQKLDAARNDPNIATVLIPENNKSDLQKVPQPIKNALEIVPVSTIDQVLQHALHDYQPAPVNDDSFVPVRQCQEGRAASLSHDPQGGDAVNLSDGANSAFRQYVEPETPIGAARVRVRFASHKPPQCG